MPSAIFKPSAMGEHDMFEMKSSEPVYLTEALQLGAIYGPWEAESSYRSDRDMFRFEMLDNPQAHDFLGAWSMLLTIATTKSVSFVSRYMMKMSAYFVMRLSIVLPSVCKRSDVSDCVM